jgi:hypothetical protein
VGSQEHLAPSRPQARPRAVLLRDGRPRVAVIVVWWCPIPDVAASQVLDQVPVVCVCVCVCVCLCVSHAHVEDESKKAPT